MTRFQSMDTQKIEAYMQSCMSDNAHDMEHVYRVLYYALNIGECEVGPDKRLLTAACLLHDIARSEQFANPGVDHATLGARKAYNWLVGNGYAKDFARAVSDCVLTHRFRSDNPPRSIEAKILFDADKLDVCGAVGIARTLLYKAHVTEPLYSRAMDGGISDGSLDVAPSFFQEYKFKLENMYDKFYTQRGRELASKRRSAAAGFYDAMLAEVRECYQFNHE